MKDQLESPITIYITASNVPKESALYLNPSPKDSEKKPGLSILYGDSCAGRGRVLVGNCSLTTTDDNNIKRGDEEQKAEMEKILKLQSFSKDNIDRLNHYYTQATYSGICDIFTFYILQKKECKSLQYYMLESQGIGTVNLQQQQSNQEILITNEYPYLSFSNPTLLLCGEAIHAILPMDVKITNVLPSNNDHGFTLKNITCKSNVNETYQLVLKNIIAQTIESLKSDIADIHRLLIDENKINGNLLKIDEITQLKKNIDKIHKTIVIKKQIDIKNPIDLFSNIKQSTLNTLSTKFYAAFGTQEHNSKIDLIYKNIIAKLNLKKNTSPPEYIQKIKKLLDGIKNEIGEINEYVKQCNNFTAPNTTEDSKSIELKFEINSTNQESKSLTILIPPSLIETWHKIEQIAFNVVKTKEGVQIDEKTLGNPNEENIATTSAQEFIGALASLENAIFLTKTKLAAKLKEENPSTLNDKQKQSMKKELEEIKSLLKNLQRRKILVKNTFEKIKQVENTLNEI
jgi:hypothetical protein